MLIILVKYLWNKFMVLLLEPCSGLYPICEPTLSRWPMQWLNSICCLKKNSHKICNLITFTGQFLSDHVLNHPLNQHFTPYCVIGFSLEFSVLFNIFLGLRENSKFKNQGPIFGVKFLFKWKLEEHGLTTIHLYSPREMTRWVRGICEAIRPLESLSVEGLVRLFVHEALRLFQDRLVYDEERIWTNDTVDEIALR